jgi:hypothetical protein
MIVDLTLTGVVVPLFIPRQYVPLDHKVCLDFLLVYIRAEQLQNPSRTPNPEQEVPLISLLVFQYLDPLVIKAYKLPHLPFEDLPSLADYDHAQVLKETTFPV